MRDARRATRHAFLHPNWLHPMEDLLRALPCLAVKPSGEIDYAASDLAVLREVAEHAEDCMRVAQEGLGALGSLLVHVAPEVDVGDLSGDVVEGLGHLMRALGALAAQGLTISAGCVEQMGGPGSRAR